MCVVVASGTLKDPYTREKFSHNRKRCPLPVPMLLSDRYDSEETLSEDRVKNLDSRIYP